MKTRPVHSFLPDRRERCECGAADRRGEDGDEGGVGEGGGHAGAARVPPQALHDAAGSEKGRKSARFSYVLLFTTFSQDFLELTPDAHLDNEQIEAI